MAGKAALVCGGGGEGRCDGSGTGKSQPSSAANYSKDKTIRISIETASGCIPPTHCLKVPVLHDAAVFRFSMALARRRCSAVIEGRWVCMRFQHICDEKVRHRKQQQQYRGATAAHLHDNVQVFRCGWWQELREAAALHVEERRLQRLSASAPGLLPPHVHLKDGAAQHVHIGAIAVDFGGQRLQRLSNSR